MYTHHYDMLSAEHRQQLHEEAANRRLLAALPRRPGMARHLVGRLGIVLVAVGSRMERFEQPRATRARRLSPIRQSS